MRLALLLLLAVAPHALYACTCIEQEPKSAFKSATTVFLGEVLSSENGVARLRPLEWFKGTESGVVELQHNISTCEYGLTPGSQHLIYAYEHLGVLTVSICTRSRPLDRAECDLRYLRSRAWWWRSPLSSLRILSRLGIRWTACPRNSPRFLAVAHREHQWFASSER